MRQQIVNIFQEYSNSIGGEIPPDHTGSLILCLSDLTSVKTLPTSIK
jgi:hypothetical protein